MAILAGGLSRRMGRDKAFEPFGQSTLLGEVQATAVGTQLPLRVIRHDLIPNLGPLGGVHTAFKTTVWDLILFLSCDMPLITLDLLETLLDCRRPDRPAAFISHGGAIGFPFWLRRAVVPILETQIEAGRLSLRGLAEAAGAHLLRVEGESEAFINVNTLSDLERARRLYRLRRAFGA